MAELKFNIVVVSFTCERQLEDSLTIGFNPEILAAKCDNVKSESESDTELRTEVRVRSGENSSSTEETKSVDISIGVLVGRTSANSPKISSVVRTNKVEDKVVEESSIG